PRWWPHLGLCTTLFILAATLVHSQRPVPASTTGGTTYASTFVEGRLFYITSLGARISMMIDLSVPWSIGNYTYKELTFPRGDFYSVAFTKDLKTIYGFEDGNMGQKHTIKTNSWEDVLNTTQMLPRKPEKMRGDPGTALDPISGNIYFAAGDTNINNPGVKLGGMTPGEYETSEGKRGLFMTALESDTWREAYFAWSSLWNRIVVFGSTGDSVNTRMTWNTMYITDGRSWNRTNTTGTVPVPRESPCMISVYNGTKIAIFGGSSHEGSQFKSDFYILDLETKVWTQGASAGAGGARSRMACASTNDYFIVYGGINSFTEASTQKHLMIYNMRTKEWVEDYTPARYVPPKPVDNTTTTTTNTGEGGATGTDDPGDLSPEETAKVSSLPKKQEQAVNLPLIIGATAGGVVVFLNTVGLIVCLTRRRNKRRNEERRKYRERWDRRDRRDGRDDSTEWGDREYKARSSHRAPSNGRSTRDMLKDGHQNGGYDQDFQENLNRHEYRDGRGDRGYRGDYGKLNHQDNSNRHEFDDDNDKRRLRGDNDMLRPQGNYDRRDLQDDHDRRPLQYEYEREYRENQESHALHASYDNRGQRGYQEGPEPEDFNNGRFDGREMLTKGTREDQLNEYEMSMKKSSQDASQSWKPQLAAPSTRSRWQDDGFDRGVNVEEDQGYYLQAHDNGYDSIGMDARGGNENSSYILGRTGDLPPTRENEYIDPRSSMRSEVPRPMEITSQPRREVSYDGFNEGSRGGNAYDGSAGGRSRGYGESTLISGLNGGQAASGGGLTASGSALGGGSHGSGRRSDFGGSPAESTRRINYTQLQSPLLEEDSVSMQSGSQQSKGTHSQQGSAFDTRYWYQQSSEATLNANKQPR
ncbi:hypothetical protein BGW38_006739, partial [Lunasporangiospora selenospora]